MKKNYKTVIVGAGFGGLNAAIKLGKKKEDVLIIDKMNHHLFQPLLYQVATAGLSPSDIAIPIREILNKCKTVKVIMDEVIDINKDELSLSTKSGKIISFENLIVATGASPSYYGNDQWESIAPGLKNLNDALNIRENILRSFELSELETDSNKIKSLTTFVVVGGGPTGVEMAGAIAEIAKKTLVKNFTNIDTSKSKVILVENGDRILNAFDNKLSIKAQTFLENLGVEVRLNSKVEKIDECGVTINEKLIESENIVWAAGNKVNPLVAKLNLKNDRTGRVEVEHDCSIKGYSNIFIIGDAAAFKDSDDYLPSLAPVAVQQGEYVAKIIYKSISRTREPFKYFDKGIMATIGKSKAIMQVGKFKTGGFFAWICWCAVHLLFLVLFRNRLSILGSWSYNYFTEKRGMRLIK